MIELFFLSEQLSNIFKLENLGIMPYTQVTPVDIKQRQREMRLLKLLKMKRIKLMLKKFPALRCLYTAQPGCAIGIGNVWKFPYVVGQNGGGLFVLIYLFFLVIPVSYTHLHCFMTSRRR